MICVAVVRAEMMRKFRAALEDATDADEGPVGSAAQRLGGTADTGGSADGPGDDSTPVDQRRAGAGRQEPQDEEKVDYAPSEEQLGQVEAAGGCGPTGH